MTEHQPWPGEEPKQPRDEEPRLAASSSPYNVEEFAQPGASASLPDAAGATANQSDAQSEDWESSATAQTDRHDGAAYATHEPESHNDRAPGNTEPDDASSGAASLLPDRDLDTANRRWHDIQSAFVDDPRHAIAEADKLVGDVLQQLISSFDAERTQFDALWSSNDGASTEELRVGLQRYRAFFQRLLSA